MAKKTKKAKIIPKKQKNIPFHKWHRLILPACTAFTVVLVILLGYFSFTETSLAPVSAGNIALPSNSSQASLERKISSAAKSFRLTITYPDDTKKTYPLSDAGMSVDAVRSSTNIKRQLKNSALERLMWWQPINLDLEVKTDETKLVNFINDKTTVVSAVPLDASLDATGGNIQVIPEKNGHGFGLENSSQMLKNTATQLDPHPLTLKKKVVPAAITSKDLEKSKQKLQSILVQKVVFGLQDKQIMPTPAEIADWVELTPVPKAKTVDVTVNAGKVVEYIDNIAAPYVALPRSQLIMNTANGPLTLDRGTGGVDIANKDEIAAQIARELLNNKGLEVGLTVTAAPAKTVELQPYDKFIVVDTTAKRMYAYEKANLVRTVPISAGAPNTPTVLGQFKIYSKRVSQDMRGANVDGSRYFQAAVPYVNYFYGSYAIHGNYWRPDSWFGNINSSHGCVGINDPDDAWIYNWAPIGTPVIVHD